METVSILLFCEWAQFQVNFLPIRKATELQLQQWRQQQQQQHQQRPYLLTPRSIVLLEKLTGLQLVKKFPAFYGTRRFITSFTRGRHLSLSWASSIQPIPPHPTFWIFILILSSHLSLGLPSGLFPPGFPTKTLNTPLLSPISQQQQQQQQPLS